MSLLNSTRLVLGVLEDLGTPFALSLAIRLRYNDMTGILDVSLDPSRYIEPLAFLLDSQALALFSKRRDLNLGAQTALAAKQKWFEAEAQCYHTNQRLSAFTMNAYNDSEVAINSLIVECQTLIMEWIGPRPPALDNLQGRFGPGATFSDRGRLATVPDKISSAPTLTKGALWHLLPWLSTKWSASASLSKTDPIFVKGNRFTTVPKNAKTDRGIAIEPSINIFYQLAYGQSIRRRLQKSTGWNLDLAADIHKNIVSQRWSSIATVDLSSASDTVCKELVRLLMPPAWFEALSELRSPMTFIDGKWVLLEKFSSMGNGYTFELETLIFAALVCTLCRREGRLGLLGTDVFVFGDDIIIEKDLARGVIAMLRFFGFIPNQKKTFSDGPFRESCGMDTFNGVNVRPFFLRSLEYEDPAQLFPIHNGFFGLYEKVSCLGFRPQHESGIDAILSALPVSLRKCTGPKGLGDTVLHVHEFPKNSWKWKDGIRYFRGIVGVPRNLPWHHWRPDVVLASALYGVGDGRLGITPRSPSLSYKVTWVPYS